MASTFFRVRLRKAHHTLPYSAPRVRSVKLAKPIRDPAGTMGFASTLYPSYDFRPLNNGSEAELGNERQFRSLACLKSMVK